MAANRNQVIICTLVYVKSTVVHMIALRLHRAIWPEGAKASFVDRAIIRYCRGYMFMFVSFYFCECCRFDSAIL